ncbi:glycosyltransferase [Cellvibrio sp. PSBB006]|uniref:glycosyltransferase n=1 Tax=Cellvibrio sp. PSBB006 TaxID=1987723 RepID=UPI000B3B7626|nr:glycosyltransferase [Cellvibrio sp. PSBB006]ARU28274.1 hypothetical protein CBR65_13015 [Cellvibrio sp. PSBB006]
MAIVNRRMKVMHIISGDLWAGAEVQAYTLLKELRTDCDLHVILMNPGELADRLKVLAIPVTLLDESKMSPVKILLGMRKIMLSFRPDIIHTHRQKENILGAIANLLSVRAKSVRTSHGAPEFTAKGMRRLQPLLDNFLGAYVQHGVISVSEDLTEKLKKIFPARNIHTIVNGVDVGALKKQAADTEFPFKNADRFHVGIIGRLEPVKRIDIFLQMAALLIKQPSEKLLQFHIIGEGAQRSILENERDRLGLGDGVLFHGHCKDIPGWINSLDAVVMCSDHEGTPMTALETLALGVPLVAHNIGGLRAILEEYPDLRVDDHTPQGYAKAVSSILQGNAPRVVLEDRYLAQHNANSTTELYETILR